MRLGHYDYIKLVTAAYKRKRSDIKYSWLAQSSPAKIKRACLNVYKEYHDKKDDTVLRNFFGSAEPGKSFVQVIAKFETSKFKPLDNYLKGVTESTDHRNLELLAWLIDFPYRPYIFDMDVELGDEELAILGKQKNELPNNPTALNSEEGHSKEEKADLQTKIEVLSNEAFTDTPLAPHPDVRKKAPPKKIFTTFLIAASFVAGGFMLWQQKKPRQMLSDNINLSCMYWTGTHYEAMSCNEDRKERFKLPLDLEKMKNFKKITREDTITEKSIGKIYYIRINGGIEYYTEGGNHPVEVTRSLRRLSAYMFNKHLKKD